MKIPIKFLVIILLSGCGSHIKVKCPPDNRTVLVLKDLSKVYPVYAKEYDIAAKRIQKAIDDTLESSTVSAGFKDRVVKFREDIKQEAINLENQLKAALLNRQTDPCDKDAGQRFDELLKSISTKKIELDGMSVKSISQEMHNSKSSVQQIMQDSTSGVQVRQHMENSPGSIQVVGDLNIQPDRTKYQPLAPNLRRDVAVALAAVHKKYEDNCPVVSISVETGNRNRQKVVWDFIDLIKSASFKPIPYWEGMSTWKGVPPPMDIKLHPDDIPFLQDFAKAISSFLLPPLLAKPDTNNQAGTVEIRFIGEPKFNSDGSIRFE